LDWDFRFEAYVFPIIATNYQSLGDSAVFSILGARGKANPCLLNPISKYNIGYFITNLVFLGLIHPDKIRSQDNILL